MKVRNIMFATVAGAGLLGTGFLIGQGPLPPNVNPQRHPNLAAAQVACDEAYAKIIAAQRANQYDMGGHAARAEHLLADARREIRLAAVDANRR